jgi:predicted dehydrogenase
MDTVRFGVIGLGNMGSYHVNYIDALQGAKLTALCDIDPNRLETAAAKFPHASRFTDYQALIGSAEVDAVIVATPHYQHPEMTIAALEKGLHVLCEKPEAVTVGQARRMNTAAADHPQLKFAINFQMRANPVLRKIRELIQGGELGEISRITWIVTNWFRTNSYYASGGWRATWSGEGGGVLINQCPHNLDQLCWLTGMMPSRITAVAHIGKTHPIEVEDEVSAIMEYPGGASGHFITTTGEAPGTDRLEIACDRGRLISENGKLSFKMSRKSVREFRQNSPVSFAQPEMWEIEIPIPRAEPDPTRWMTQNFVNAILKDEPLIAPGSDGIKQLELGNAMLLAGITRQPVDLPVEEEAIEQLIQDLSQKYAGQKDPDSAAVPGAGADMASSFGRQS